MGQAGTSSAYERLTLCFQSWMGHCSKTITLWSQHGEGRSSCSAGSCQCPSEGPRAGGRGALPALAFPGLFMLDQLLVCSWCCQHPRVHRTQSEPRTLLGMLQVVLSSEMSSG